MRIAYALRAIRAALTDEASAYVTAMATMLATAGAEVRVLTETPVEELTSLLPAGVEVVQPDPAPPDRWYHRARQLVAVLGHERSEAQVVHASALTRAHAGDLDGAVADVRAGLAAFGMLGDRPWQVRSLGRLGLALAARSQSAAAADAWREALRIQRELDLPGESRLRRWLDGLPAPDTPG